MIPNEFAKKFTGAAGLSICSAVFNLASTVAIVRWCGAPAYADFIVDLAVLSLLLLLLEVVPSNFSVFRLQEDVRWQKIVRWHLVVAAVCLVAVLFFLSRVGWPFEAFSVWIAVYALTQTFKRYLDLMLQSSGRLPEFMALDAASAVARLGALAIGFSLGVEGSPLIWGSLAVAVAVTQLSWLAVRRRTLTVSMAVREGRGQVGFVETFAKFTPYYPGILLKRMKDSLLPLVGNLVLGSKEALGLLLLAYRGTVFASGQLRIFEALLYHRDALRSMEELPLRSKMLLAVCAQSLAIAASMALLVLSNEPNKPYAIAVLLSLLVYPITLGAIERASAYSGFHAGRINSGLVVYVVVVFLGAGILMSGDFAPPYTVAGLFITAEALQYAFIRRLRIRTERA